MQAVMACVTMGELLNIEIPPALGLPFQPALVGWPLAATLLRSRPARCFMPTLLATWRKTIPIFSMMEQTVAWGWAIQAHNICWMFPNPPMTIWPEFTTSTLAARLADFPFARMARAICSISMPTALTS